MEKEESAVSYMMLAEELGFKKGRLEGKEEGRVLGVTAVLERLLELKFNILPEEYRRQIQEAEETSLLKWSERVLDAKTLEEVFSN